MMAYDEKVIGMHAPIKVRVTKEINGEKVSGIIDATAGRLIFNEFIPQDIGYVDRTKKENLLKLEMIFLLRKRTWCNN